MTPAETVAFLKGLLVASDSMPPSARLWALIVESVLNTRSEGAKHG